ncbi:MAG: 4Fe-4S binding protein [Lentimicrobiaceae bacterium]|nr:4Fe-4S binding protein [Lentimicrobiaceae bacterium]MCB9024070.1 4Fe-4S binding protein [Lentimicrobiaceae bacterium]HPG33282.1 4Fe-4S binding protein [Lentimicrobium sp.]
MKSILTYITEIIKGIWTLLTGMKITGKYFFTPWKHVTQQYPENRQTLKIAERFRGEVVMPHNENNEHKCTGCGICEINCPNGSIEIISKSVMTEDGKKRRAIDKHIYHLGMCTFCNLCVKACPTGAIVMAQNFEHAVWDRATLTKVLNKPDSRIMEGVKD